MVFNLLNYNYILGFGILFFLLILLSQLFKNNLSSILDPLFYHLIWISAVSAFLIIYAIKYGISPIWTIFIISICYYTFVLYLLLREKRKIDVKTINFSARARKKIFFLLCIAISVILFSKKSAIVYMIEHEFIEWFLYRFIDFQGRDPLERITGYGIVPIFYFLSFTLLFIVKEKKFFVILVLVCYSLLEVLLGGRSALLVLLFSFGFFVYFYYDFFDKNTIRKINIYGCIFIFFAIILSMIISSAYSNTYSLNDGIFIIINRLMASADGMEYYLKYNGYENIDSGIVSYLFAVFGIYIKRITDIEYKNIGHQLSELVVGELDYTVGSNFFFPLQVMVLGYYFFPIYIFFLSYITSKMRKIKPVTNSLTEHIIKYILGFSAFFIALDIELAVFRMICFVLVFIFFYPFIKFTLHSQSK